MKALKSKDALDRIYFRILKSFEMMLFTCLHSEKTKRKKNLRKPAN